MALRQKSQTPSGMCKSPRELFIMGALTSPDRRGFAYIMQIANSAITSICAPAFTPYINYYTNMNITSNELGIKF